MADRSHGRHCSCSFYRLTSQGSGQHSHSRAAGHHRRRLRQRSRDSKHSAWLDQSRSLRWRSPSSFDEGSCILGSSGRHSDRHGGRRVRFPDEERPSRRVSLARADPEVVMVSVSASPREAQQSSEFDSTGAWGVGDSPELVPFLKNLLAKLESPAAS